MGNHDKLNLHQQHIAKVAAKHETLKGKIALLETYEKLDDGNSEEIHQYVLELRAKVRNVTNQIKAMKPISDRDRDEYEF